MSAPPPFTSWVWSSEGDRRFKYLQPKEFPSLKWEVLLHICARHLSSQRGRGQPPLTVTSQPAYLHDNLVPVRMVWEVKHLVGLSLKASTRLFPQRERSQTWNRSALPSQAFRQWRAVGSERGREGAPLCGAAMVTTPPRSSPRLRTRLEAPRFPDAQTFLVGQRVQAMFVWPNLATADRLYGQPPPAINQPQHQGQWGGGRLHGDLL